ncbi:hypothetical protein GCM10007108_12060 [Thermogymnomonas acidicola]|uniref:3-hydroxyacyl-CoA dehydrogenase n=1 Tax=Thermogymnomonas acidicola TaxID=399579 RepID=A0AA37BRT7_9ARCH|nr:3-hydroxyacyl-CoA dehydrogenase family protein [Thermogymnomonas acidicola]GGM75716.1 hypothetical protein GCM10007108_12060 [Thermogymnomonas acidicola]
MASRVSVIGFGTMGSGIAEVFALRGMDVRVYEVSDAVFGQNVKAVRSSVERLRQRGITAEGPDDVLGRIRRAGSIEECVRDSEVVVEAVNEDAALKRDVFRKVSMAAPGGAVLSTNTSSISITYIQRAAERPERVAGLHWFNPPVLMRLVEVVRGDLTSDSTVEALEALGREVGKEVVVCRRDIRGFIGNRIIRAMKYHCTLLVRSARYTVRQIDASLVHGIGMPLGIFALTDFTGGLVLESQESRTYAEIVREVPGYEPSLGYHRMFMHYLSLVAPMVQEGRTGYRQGRGFYDYPGPGVWERPELRPEEAEGVEEVHILAPVYNQAEHMVRHGVCNEGDIERALRYGFNVSRPLMPYVRERFGEWAVESTLREFSDTYSMVQPFYSRGEW